MRWRRRESPGIAEAQAHIDRIERQQPEVTRLIRELQEASHRKRLSELIIIAALRGAS